MNAADLGTEALDFIDYLERNEVGEVDVLVFVARTSEGDVIYRTSGGSTYDNINALSRAIAMECATEQEHNDG